MRVRSAANGYIYGLTIVIGRHLLFGDALGITLSHISALDAMRTLRCGGTDIHAMETTTLRAPSPWRGSRWTMGPFESQEWWFAPPDNLRHLHVLAPQQTDSVRMANVETRVYARALIKGSILVINQNISMVCPELLFLQLARSFSLPTLVMLGYELCGNFSRNSDNPLYGDVVTPVPAATTVESIARYLDSMPHAWGVKRARKALEFASDKALSAPEALLSTIYSLTENESGYGMGPITLNERVHVADDENGNPRFRYPDLLFPFARLGINYDGEEHLDLSGLTQAAQLTVLETEKNKHDKALLGLLEKQEAVREKYADDNARDRRLASSGYLVFRATKEDLESSDALDSFTRDILNATHNLMGVDVTPYLALLDDTIKMRDRKDLFDLLRYGIGGSSTMHGLM